MSLSVCARLRRGRAGIENMLRYYIPEVIEVRPV